jgi:hypothetical protein
MMKIIPYSYLENEATARLYLTQKYKHPETKILVYQNVYAFTSYIKQGLALFKTSDACDFWSKPLLLYYGIMSLLKALALSMDSYYPQSTSILQHGLTSPKRKKEPFRFDLDEVRVQKDGFFPYLCKLLDCPIVTGERYKVELLCSFLPDLQPTVERLYQKRDLWPITIVSDQQTWTVSISIALLDHLCLSTGSFINRLNRVTSHVFFHEGETTDAVLTLLCHSEPQHHPWVYPKENGDCFLWIKDSHQVEALPEILAQYALLFSLSMLCRYHPPLWRELYNDTKQDQLLIQEIIAIVQRKFPVLVLQLLQME